MSDNNISRSVEYDWLFYNLITLIITNIVLLIINIRFFLKYRRIDNREISRKKKIKHLREIIKRAVWFWGHGSAVIKNFDKLVSKNVKIVTLEALTRTWTQHYKKSFQKLFNISEKEAAERAEAQKKKDIQELYDLLKDKIEIKVIPITFGKYAGSYSYQIEIWDEEREEKS
ncbi:MAG: hypothetical protein ACTSYB_06140 [Candidatus Helarchaeota archaeon]